ISGRVQVGGRRRGAGGRSALDVAAELGLLDQLVRSWLGWAQSRPNLGSAAPAPTLSKASATLAAVWDRARPTKPPRSCGCGASSTGCGWSVTPESERRSSSARRQTGGELWGTGTTRAASPAPEFNALAHEIPDHPAR